MLESLSDLISIVVLIGLVLAGICLLYVVMDHQRDVDLRNRAERFYRFYEEFDDEDEENDDLLS